MTISSERSQAPTPAELEAFDALAERAAAGVVEGITRPTRAPFPWAEPLLTVGVTGTNGKTSTTHLLSGVLRAAGRGVVTESTVGYWLDEQRLSVPRTSRGFLSAMKQAAGAGCRYAVVEVTSASLARGFARVWRYDLGIFTNLSRDHVEQHGSWEHYLASKAQLFVHLPAGATAVLNACDPAAQLIERVTPPDVARRFFAVPSRGQPLRAADLAAVEVGVTARGTQIRLAPSELSDALGGELSLAFVGEVFAENALGAALAALSLGVTPEQVRRGLAECPVVPGRFQIVSTAPVVAVDFAHTPDALARTASTARRIAAGGRVVFVFGAGGEKDKAKREPMGRAVGESADAVFITSDNPRREDPRAIARALEAGCRRGGRAYVRVELDRRRAIQQAVESLRAGDVLVVAGKGHENGQIIGDVTHPFSDVEEITRALGAAASPE